MNEKLIEALDSASELYAEYLAVSGQGQGVVAGEAVEFPEPLRNSAYPVGFALDDRKVNALVG